MKSSHQVSASFAFNTKKRRNLLLTSHKNGKRGMSYAINNRSKHISKKGSIEDYELKEMLGKGSYGEVYKATHKDTGKELAIKIYDKLMMSQLNK